MVTSALIYRQLKVGAANFLVHQWIEQQPCSFFDAGIKNLVPRWDKCLNVFGGYVEKYKLLFSEGFTYCLIWKLLFSNIHFVGPLHFLFALCKNYTLLHVFSNWTELSIPCSVISCTSLQNFQKMLKIEFPTKRISRIYNVSKIEKTAAFGSLYMIRPSYIRPHFHKCWIAVSTKFSSYQYSPKNGGVKNDLWPTSVQRLSAIFQVNFTYIFIVHC